MNFLILNKFVVEGDCANVSRIELKETFTTVLKVTSGPALDQWSDVSFRQLRQLNGNRELVVPGSHNIQPAKRAEAASDKCKR